MSAGEESIARSTSFALAAQTAGAGFTAILTLYLVRALGPGGYGVFAVALAVSTLLLLAADLGLANATARFVAAAAGDRTAVAAIMAQGLRLKLIASLAVGVTLAALAGPIAHAYGMPALAWPLRGMAVALVAHALMLHLTTSFAALGRLRLQLSVVVWESSVETSASIALVAVGGGAAAAALGRAIGYLVGAGIAVAFLVRMLGPPALPRLRPPGAGARRLARYAGALLVIDGAFVLFAQVDVLLLGGLAGAGAAGLFQASLRLATMLALPGIAAANAIAPRAARSTERPFGPLQAALRRLLALGALQAALLLAFAEPIGRLVLGPGYGDAAAVIRALAPYVLLGAVAPLASVAVNYAGAAARRVPIALATVAVNVVLDLLLIPRLGVVGAAIGTDVAFTGYVVAHLVLCRSVLGVELRALAFSGPGSGPSAAWRAARQAMPARGADRSA